MLGTLGDLHGTSQGSRVLAGLTDAVDKDLYDELVKHVNAIDR